MPHSPLSDRALGERQLVGEVLLVYSYLLKEEEEENGTHVLYSCLCTIDSCYLYLLYLTAFVVIFSATIVFPPPDKILLQQIN